MDVAMGAVRCRDKDKALTLLRKLQASVQLTQPDKNKLLCIAGVMGRVDAAEFMLHEGAEWPQRFVEQLQQSIDDLSTALHCWPPKAVHGHAVEAVLGVCGRVSSCHQSSLMGSACNVKLRTS
jgi:hypothetical protein